MDGERWLVEHAAGASPDEALAAAPEDDPTSTTIAQIYAELIRPNGHGHPEPDPATPAAGSYFAYAAAEAEVTAVHLAGSPQTREWQDIFRRHDLQMPRFPLDLGLSPGETAQVAGVEVSLLDRAGIVAFDAVCRAAGGRFVDGIYAAIAEACEAL